MAVYMGQNPIQPIHKSGKEFFAKKWYTVCGRAKGVLDGLDQGHGFDDCGTLICARYIPHVPSQSAPEGLFRS